MKNIILFIIFLLSQNLLCQKSAKAELKVFIEVKIQNLESKIETLEKENDSLNKQLNTFLINDYKSTDVIDKVENYYENAWNKLIYMLSIIGGIMVVLLPIVLTWQQKRELKLNKLDFQEDVDRKILELENRILTFNTEEIEKVRNDIQELNNNISEKQKRDIKKIYAMTYYLQGLHAKASDNPDLIIKSFITAINSLIAGKSHTNIGLSLGNIIDAMKLKIKKQTKLSKTAITDLENIIASLKENYPKKFDYLLDQLQEKIDELS